MLSILNFAIYAVIRIECPLTGYTIEKASQKVQEKVAKTFTFVSCPSSKFCANCLMIKNTECIQGVYERGGYFLAKQKTFIVSKIRITQSAKLCL